MNKIWKEHTWLVVFVGIFIMVAIPIVILFGISYIAPLILIVLLYLYVNKVKYEDVISPRDFEEMNDYLKELEERAALIKEHLEMYEGDLEAKFELREINKEIESIKKDMGL